jgi:hypothetical protein
MTNTMEKQKIPDSCKIVTLNTNKWAVTFLAWYICTSLQGDVVKLVVRTYPSSHREMMLNVTHLSDMTINAVTILATILIFLCFLFSMGFRPWPFSFLFSMCNNWKSLKSHGRKHMEKRKLINHRWKHIENKKKEVMDEITLQI